MVSPGIADRPGGLSLQIPVFYLLGVERLMMAVGQPFQIFEDGGMVLGQFRQGLHPLRPDQQLIFQVEVYQTISAKSQGMDVGGTDGGVVLAHCGPFFPDPDLTLVDQGDIGCGSSHIDHQGFVQVSQEFSSQGAGGWTGMDCFYRSVPCCLRADQGAVPPDDHQWSLNGAFVEGGPHGLNKGLQDG